MTIEIREHYRIINPADLADLTRQLNTILSRIGDRLDKMDGTRGTPAFEADIDLQGHNILNVGTITAESYLP